MPSGFVNLAYLLAAALFILGLRGLGHPRTAVRGNLLGAVAMLIAVVVNYCSLIWSGSTPEAVSTGVPMGAFSSTSVPKRMSVGASLISRTAISKA